MITHTAFDISFLKADDLPSILSEALRHLMCLAGEEWLLQEKNMFSHTHF